MTLEEKLKLFKDRGFKYNPITGEVTSPSGNILKCKSNGYINMGIKINKKSINVLAHQFAWYMYYDIIPDTIDHINKGYENKSNNKIENLRNVTHQQNGFNTNAKGYTYDKSRSKYQAKIRVDGKYYFLGRFDTEEEAHQAYLDAKLIYHKI